MNYNLLPERSMFIELDNSTYEGFTESGIQLSRRDFTLTGTWKNTARVIMAHASCRDVKADDMIVFKKHAPKKLRAIAGELLVLFEYQIHGIVRRANGSPWFAV